MNRLLISVPHHHELSAIHSIQFVPLVHQQHDLSVAISTHAKADIHIYIRKFQSIPFHSPALVINLTPSLDRTATVTHSSIASHFYEIVDIHITTELEHFLTQHHPTAFQALVDMKPRLAQLVNIQPKLRSKYDVQMTLQHTIHAVIVCKLTHRTEKTKGVHI